jgi:hypothetical protein
LPIPRKIGYYLAGSGMRDDRADRHMQHNVLGSLAIAVGAFAVFAVPGAVHAGKTVIDQRIDVAVGNRENTAAAASVPSRRAAPGNVFLAAKACGSVSTFSGHHLDYRFIYVFHASGRGCYPKKSAKQMRCADGNLFSFPELSSNKKALS